MSLAQIKCRSELVYRIGSMKIPEREAKAWEEKQDEQKVCDTMKN